MKTLRLLLFSFLTLLCSLSGLRAQPTDEAIRQAMKAATQAMMDKVSYRGGFVWYYLTDGSRQWGELEAKPTMVWMQSPGTPQVGHILLDAYHATNDEYYYQAAQTVAGAIIWGQQEEGGWNYVFDYAGEGSLKSWYATVGRSAWRLEEFQHYYGNSTYDDGGTMDAAKFLLRMYVEKNDPTYRPALDKVIRLVLNSQYPSGGWPQRYPLMYDHPFQGQADYSSFITLNDDVMPDIIEFLTMCYQAIGLREAREPVMRAMYLMIALQQGAPYAGWADQYTTEDLRPAHARSYEPRSVNTGTTARMVRLMLSYYRLTGDTRFLSGIPAALDFIQSVKLPAEEVKKWTRRPRTADDILVPRFIQPETGEPLYVHRRGTNVVNGMYYTDQELANTIAHYSSAAYINVKALRQEYEEALQTSPADLAKNSPFIGDELVPLPRYFTNFRGSGPDRATSASVLDDAARLIGSLNADGFWIVPLRNTSNPYKPNPGSESSTSTQYATTMVGDEYDTSPYPCTTGEQCISTGDYINNMRTLIEALSTLNGEE